jgi:hypothetical protein
MGEPVKRRYRMGEMNKAESVKRRRSKGENDG